MCPFPCCFVEFVAGFFGSCESCKDALNIAIDKGCGFLVSDGGDGACGIWTNTRDLLPLLCVFRDAVFVDPFCAC